MKAAKRKKLDTAGWRIGTVADFLELSDVEARLVELRLALADALKTRRAALHISQRAVAEAIGSSQSRVAKIEAADGSVSLDLMVRGVLATGATVRDIADAIRHERAPTLRAKRKSGGPRRAA